MSGPAKAESAARQDLEVEREVLAALLVAGDVAASRVAVARVADVGLRAQDFSESSHRLIYAAIAGLAEQERPTEARFVSERLRELGQLEQAGEERIAELASLPTSAETVPFLAERIVRRARLGELVRQLGPIVEGARNGGIDREDALARLDLARPLLIGGDTRRFDVLAHKAALAREVPPTTELVAGLVEAGTIGQLAGLPETYKTWLAIELAHKVAAGGGQLLGREVKLGGPVGYFWQDDSEANELARLQAYAGRHNYADLPLNWILNQGLQLPDHIGELRALIVEHGWILVILDSLYNFLGGLENMKDEQVAQVLIRLKTDVCDETGCTVAFVDHAGWPTDANKGAPRRGYGSVFKAAATRWGIYPERQGEKFWIEARGNNIGGLSRSLAEFDAERLELRLIDTPPPIDQAELREKILNAVDAEPGCSQRKVETATGRNSETVRKGIAALIKEGVLVDRGSSSGKKLYIVADEAQGSASEEEPEWP